MCLRGSHCSFVHRCIHFWSGVKATEKVETGYLLGCILTCGAAESIISRREASSRLSETSQGGFFFVFFFFSFSPLRNGRVHSAGVESEDPQRNCSLHSYTWLGRQMVHVKTTAVIAEQRHPLYACVCVSALWKRCRNVLALSRRQQRRHHKTSKR